MATIALADDLRVALVRLGRRMRRERLDQALAPHHLSALGAIQQLEQPTLARIAACEGVKPPSMVKTLQYLEELDYVERSAHPSDGRMLVLRISGNGERKLAAMRERRNRTLADAMEKMSPDEQQTLAKAIPLLERLAEP